MDSNVISSVTSNVSPVIAQDTYVAMSCVERCSFKKDDNFHLMVYIGDTPFAIELARLKEVTHCKLPSATATANGIPHALSLRDGSVPVIDLCMYLTSEQSRLNGRSSILIVEGESGGRTLDVGFLVDRVGRLVVGDVCASAGAANDLEHFVCGELTVGGQAIKLLDIDELLRDIAVECEYAC